MLQCVKEWSAALSDKKPTFVVYLDFRKAFDSISHPKLLIKLRSFGICGDVLAWISDYLTGRSQRVSIGSTESTAKPVTAGILQGSCVGPILFVLYINDLLNALSKITSCKAFADDVKLYSSDPAELQSALELVEKWCATWQLTLSVEKCSVLTVGPVGPAPVLYLLGTPLPVVDSMRDLGILVDSNLSFSEHVSSLCKKARRTSALVFKSFTSGSIPLLVRAFKTYVRPQLEFGSQVWNSISKRDSQRLESVQRRFTKFLYLRCGLSKRATYEQRLRRLGLDTLRSRRLKLDMCLTYQIYNGLSFAPSLLCPKPALRARSLRHNHRLLQDRTGTRKTLSAYHNRICVLWNAIPDSVVEGSLDNFKRYIGLC
jgi:hypothetical protein